MLSKMTVKTKLTLLGVATSLLLAVSGAAAIFEMGRMAAEVEHDLQAGKTDSEAMTAVESAQIGFKKQVQKWKNILLRGNDPKAYDKYLAEFGVEEANTRASLNRAVELFRARGIPTDDVEATLRDHRDLGAKYRAALSQFDKADPLAGRKVDATLKSIDRPAEASIDRIAAKVEAYYAGRIAEQMQRTESLYRSARNLLIVATALGLILSAGFSLHILRDLMRRLGGEPEYAARRPPVFGTILLLPGRRPWLIRSFSALPLSANLRAIESHSASDLTTAFISIPPFCFSFLVNRSHSCP